MEAIHWSEIWNNVGTLVIGVGTLALAWVGYLANRTYKEKHKDPKLSKQYEKLAYAIFREVEGKFDFSEGGREEFPDSIPKLVERTATHLGCPESIVQAVLDDVIKEGHFSYVRGSANVQMKVGVDDDGNVEHKPDKLV